MKANVVGHIIEIAHSIQGVGLTPADMRLRAPGEGKQTCNGKSIQLDPVNQSHTEG